MKSTPRSNNILCMFAHNRHFKFLIVGMRNRDGDISWTMTSRGHYFSKWATFRGHSQRVTFRGHFW